MHNPIRTDSRLMKLGEDSFRNADAGVLTHLGGIPHVPVQRNNGIDAFLKHTFLGVPIPVRIQRHGESLFDATGNLHKAGSSKNAKRMILIATEDVPILWPNAKLPLGIVVIDTTTLTIQKLVSALKNDQEPAEKRQSLVG